MGNVLRVARGKHCPLVAGGGVEGSGASLAAGATPVGVLESGAGQDRDLGGE